MKINLKDVFENENMAFEVPERSIASPIDGEFISKTKANVFSQLGIESKSRKSFGRAARIVAIAAVIAVFISGLSVSAMTYFLPDNALNQAIEFNSKVDYSTLGTDINQVCESNGLEFKLTQVLCDNNIMMLALECPKYKGGYVQPEIVGFDVSDSDEVSIDEDSGQHIFLSVNGKKDYLCNSFFNGSDAAYYKVHRTKLPENMCYITYTELKNIHNNSKIKFSFDRLAYFDAESAEFPRVEGNWNFEFAINRSNTRKRLDSAKITLENGQKYKIKNISISPLGMYFDYKLDNTDSKALDDSLCSANQDKTLKITMKDGTVYTDGVLYNDMETQSSSGTINGLKHHEGCFEAFFKVAIDVDNIESITVLNEIIYQSKG